MDDSEDERNIYYHANVKHTKVMKLQPTTALVVAHAEHSAPVTPKQDRTPAPRSSNPKGSNTTTQNPSSRKSSKRSALLPFDRCELLESFGIELCSLITDRVNSMRSRLIARGLWTRPELLIASKTVRRAAQLCGVTSVFFKLGLKRNHDTMVFTNKNFIFGAHQMLERLRLLTESEQLFPQCGSLPGTKELTKYAQRYFPTTYVFNNVLPNGASWEDVLPFWADALLDQRSYGNPLGLFECYFLVTEWLDSRFEKADLLVQAVWRLTPHERVEWVLLRMREMACAVFALHAHCLCHGDLKPENFLIRLLRKDIQLDTLDSCSARGIISGCEAVLTDLDDACPQNEQWALYTEGFRDSTAPFYNERTATYRKIDTMGDMYSLGITFAGIVKLVLHGTELHLTSFDWKPLPKLDEAIHCLELRSFSRRQAERANLFYTNQARTALDTIIADATAKQDYCSAQFVARFKTSIFERMVSSNRQERIDVYGVISDITRQLCGDKTVDAAREPLRALHSTQRQSSHQIPIPSNFDHSRMKMPAKRIVGEDQKSRIEHKENQAPRPIRPLS